MGTMGIAVIRIRRQADVMSHSVLVPDLGVARFLADLDRRRIFLGAVLIDRVIQVNV
jgi:hypothetical protein